MQFCAHTKCDPDGNPRPKEPLQCKDGKRYFDGSPLGRLIPKCKKEWLFIRSPLTFYDGRHDF